MSLQYLQKKVGDEVDFLPADKHESFLLVEVSPWVCIARQAQSSQNNKFVISLQYLKENVKNEVDFFLPADKHQWFLQIDTIILGMCGQACPINPK